MGKTQAEIDDMPHREIAEHFVMIAGVDKFDGRSPLEKALDRMAGLA
jgi:hypothetical protein